MEAHLARAIRVCCLAIMALSIGITNANASVFNFTYTGVFTLLDPAGDLVLNTDATTNSYSGYRTDVSGSYSIDMATGAGSMTTTPFDFFGGGPLQVTSGLTTNIGDGMGNPGNLMLGNFIFDWNGNVGIQMDLVWDATGLFDALNNSNIGPGSVISGNQLFNPTGPSPVTIGSVLPASNSVMVGPTSFPIGPTPMATTAFDVTTGTGPGGGGGLPVITDASGIAGSPMVGGPNPGFSLSLDIGNLGSMHLVSVTASPVPVPGAVWLFGSGLFGLAGVARRGKVT